MLFDMVTRQELRRFGDQRAGIVADLKFSGNGRFLWSASSNGVVQLWDVATGQELQRVLAPSKGTTRVVVSPMDENSVLVGSTDGTLFSWQIETLTELTEWIRNNRYIAEIPCQQRQQYVVQPSCELE